jgi:hypothetical protein
MVLLCWTVCPEVDRVRSRPGVEVDLRHFASPFRGEVGLDEPLLIKWMDCTFQV